MSISTDQMIPWQDNSRIKQSSIAEPSPGPFNCFSVQIFLNLVSKNLQVNFFCSVIKIVRNNLKFEIKMNWIFRTFLNISYNHAEPSPKLRSCHKSSAPCRSALFNNIIIKKKNPCKYLLQCLWREPIE